MLEKLATIVRLDVAVQQVAVAVQAKGIVFRDRNVIFVNLGPLGVYEIPVATLRADQISFHRTLLVAFFVT